MQDTMHLNSISIGPRARKDLGDIDSLAASIAAVGLLNPACVTPSGQLIAGRRRIEAVRRLGWSHIPVTIIDIEALALGEAIENSQRKALLPTEIVGIALAVIDEERARARARQGMRTDLREDFPEVEPGRTADRVGVMVGVSGRTLRKMLDVWLAAEADPDTFGPLLEEMDKTNSIDGPYKRYRKIILPPRPSSNQAQLLATDASLPAKPALLTAIASDSGAPGNPEVRLTQEIEKLRQAITALQRRVASIEGQQL